MNKQWILRKFPVGEIKEGDLVLHDSEIPKLIDGQILIKNIYLCFICIVFFVINIRNIFLSF